MSTLWAEPPDRPYVICEPDNPGTFGYDFLLAVARYQERLYMAMPLGVIAEHGGDRWLYTHAERLVAPDWRFGDDVSIFPVGVHDGMVLMQVKIYGEGGIEPVEGWFTCTACGRKLSINQVSDCHGCYREGADSTCYGNGTAGACTCFYEHTNGPHARYDEM